LVAVDACIKRTGSGTSQAPALYSTSSLPKPEQGGVPILAVSRDAVHIDTYSSDERTTASHSVTRSYGAQDFQNQRAADAVAGSSLKRNA